MLRKISIPANVFWQIVRRDLTIHFKNYKATLVNTIILFACNILTFAYLFPTTDSGYGAFYFMGSLVTFGFFSGVMNAYELIGDVEGDRSINYLLTMPLPSWLTFVAIGLSWSLRTIVNIAPMFILGKLLLWEQLDLSKIHYVPFIFQFITASLFYGFFGLWTATMFKRMSDAGNIWLRMVNPMFLFGAFMFSWKSIAATMPWVSIVLLLNPIVYANEGMRATGLDPNNYIPFWICNLVLWGCTLLFGWWGIRRLRTWLDSI